MSKSFYEDQAEEMLKRIQGAHAFILSNPGCTTKEIAAHLGLNFSQAQYAYHALTESGHIRMQMASAGGMRSRYSTYYVINETKPDTVVRKRSTDNPRTAKRIGEMNENRPRVKAKQIGMTRDPMIESFFGKARTAVIA